MADNWLGDFVRVIIQEQGKRRPPQPVNFAENEIVTRGDNIRIREWASAYYFNANPNAHIVLTAPDGSLLLVSGGYNRLEPGLYLQNFVDKRTRTATLKEITDTTLDGAKVSITLTMSYTVSDPIKALKSEHPVDIFYSLIQAYALQFIKEHTHDEIMGITTSKDADRDAISRFISLQYNSHHNPSKVFSINEIVSKRQGDPKLAEIRRKGKENSTELEFEQQLLDLRQQVAKKDIEIQKIKAEANAEIDTIRTEAENKFARLRNEREKDFQTWKHQFEIDNLVIQAFASMNANPGYHPTPQEYNAIQEFYNRVSNKPGEEILTDEETSPPAPAPKPATPVPPTA
jgi:hypothetical protein